MRADRFVVCLLAVAALAGCASRPINEPITQFDLKTGYRPILLIPKRQNNDPHTLFILSFSGGGTRAAAFSYGVLEELRRTGIVIDGQRRRLIDEVDLMTGVSGGSFTALAYALYGEGLFAEYEGRFLERNVQGVLIRRFLNPFNWPRLMGSAGRSELAAEYYDEILFEGATFGDLLDKQTPVAGATGTDLSTGSQLAFLQSDFDLLCSDLSAVRLSRAAAASSAVPGILSPVTLDNYGGTCGYQYPAWVNDVAKLQGSRWSGRATERYREMRAFQDGKDRPFIHLVDGGVADNLGVRPVLELFEELAVSGEYRDVMHLREIRRVVLIVVNARSEKTHDWDRRESPPMFAALQQATSVPIARYSFESVETMKDRQALLSVRRELQIARARLAGATEAEAEAEASVSVPKLSLTTLDVSFDAIPDPDERAYFMRLPTSFVLPAEDVDRLREVAGRLMRESPDFQSVVREFGGLPAK